MEENQSDRIPQPVPKPESDRPPEFGGTGYLIVRVTTAMGAIPLSGAQVDIRNYADEDTEEPEVQGDILTSMRTGRDGKTAKVALPTPPAAASESPGARQPFARYSVDVSLPGYRRQTYLGVPVFDGITSLQSANLVPLPEDGSGGTAPNTPEYFPESGYPGL